MPTFLLTDVEGSTRLWDVRADEMSRALERHDTIVIGAIAEAGGEHKRARGEGDSHFAVFQAPADAVVCALNIQLALGAELWPEGVTLRVRIGIHTGTAELRGDEFYGSTVNRAARLRALAHGGQTVLSKAVADAAAPPAPATFRDHGSHRLKDLEEPERVYELCHPEIEDDFPPLLSLDAVRHNLPVQMTSFVGRDDEVAALRKMFEEARLVTLVGPGGIGKTRLSLQVAAELVDDFRDGVWFVELAAVTDPGIVADAVLDAMRVRSSGDALDALVDVLAGRTTLLVLDNCEQVIGGVASVVAELLGRCPDVRSLATSREPIAVAGERVVRVPALSNPDDDDDPLASVYPAVRLFVERAMSARDDFVLDERTTGPVVRICRRLDGVPLAIELAAARINVLTPLQIDERMDDRFRVLASGPRTADVRQRTLRETVDWSHDLLDERERVLFRRLGTFVGGFPLEGAEEVCGIDPLETTDVLDLLAALVDKSLVVAEHGGEAARYRMLETIAAYARERLDDSGEFAQMRDAHLRFYAETVRRFAGHLEPEISREGLRWVVVEIDNMRAAAEHAIQTDTAAGLSLMWHAYELWDVSHQSEGADRFGALLAAHPARDVHRLYGLTGYGLLLQGLGRSTVAIDALVEAVGLARELRHAERLSAALVALAHAQREVGELHGAATNLAEAETIARQEGNDQGIAYVLTGKGTLLIENDVAGAIAAFEEALRLRRKGGVIGHTIEVLGMLANAYELAGRLSDARAAAFEGMETARAEGYDGNLMYLAISLGRIALAEGDHERARASLDEGLTLAERASLLHDAAFAHALLGEMARAEGDIDVARYHYGLACDIFDRHGTLIPASFVRSNIARLELTKGNTDEARTLALTSLRVATEIGFEHGTVEFLELMGEVDAATGNAEHALRSFGAAERLREQVGAERELVDQADYDRGVAAARAALGDRTDAMWAAGREAGAEAVAAELLDD